METPKSRNRWNLSHIPACACQGYLHSDKHSAERQNEVFGTVKVSLSLLQPPSAVHHTSVHALHAHTNPKKRVHVHAQTHAQTDGYTHTRLADSRGTTGGLLTTFTLAYSTLQNSTAAVLCAGRQTEAEMLVSLEPDNSPLTGL